MLSYNNIISSKNFIKNKKKLNNYKTYKLNFYNLTRVSLNSKNYFIFIPHNWNFTIIYNNTKQVRIFYFYSNLYFFKFSLPLNKVSININRNLSLIQFNTPYTNNFFNLYWSNLNLVFNCFHKPFFLKLKFKGKGYYIFKNKRNTITPQFGYSHRLYLYAYFVSVKFLSKTSIFIFGVIKSDILKVGLGIYNMRPINIFTGRGVRFSRQIIYKKVGKVSSYR